MTATVEHQSRRPPLWELAVVSFVPPARRSEASAWVRRLPLTLLVLLQVGLSARLSNTAFQDEATYVATGRAYLNAWFAGQPAPRGLGDYLSGFPVLYPVVAGLLNSAGGLWLVRAFSLVLMIAAMLCLRGTVRHLWGERCGNLAALAFVLVGPVIFLGWFATFDAACVTALSAAIWVGVTRCSYGSAAMAGLLLALAGLLKYTGAAFIPIVVGVMLASAHRPISRAVVAGAVSSGVLASLYLLCGSSVQHGIEFTTTGRVALVPAPRSQLLYYIPTTLGPILMLALIGAWLLVRSGSLRRCLLVVVSLTGAALLPAAQLRLGESVSFEKHLAYSALFLAPLAGFCLVRMTKRNLSIAVVIAVVWIAGAIGLDRSHAMYYQWPNVDRVVALVKADPAPGVYLSSAPELAYYTTDLPQIKWESKYSLFDSGRGSMRSAVTNRHFEFVALRVGRVGDRKEEERTASMIRDLNQSPNYQLITKPFPIMPYSRDTWRVYRLVPQQEGGTR
jgi:hypothetical protein